MVMTKRRMTATKPRVDRPHIPGYGIPTHRKGILPWSHVVERMEGALNYWIGTVEAEGQPHATPVWGAWLDNQFYFDGSPETRRMRNLAVNPKTVVHLESGSDVVIIQGITRFVSKPIRALTERLAASYTSKYEAAGYAPKPEQWDNGGLYVVEPRLVFAWTKFPADTTRWKFE